MPLRKSKQKKQKKQKRQIRKTRRVIRRVRKTRKGKKMNGGNFSYGTEIPKGATRIVKISGVPTVVSDDVYIDYQDGTYERDDY
jgi:hypothetical protein